MREENQISEVPNIQNLAAEDAKVNNFATGNRRIVCLVGTKDFQQVLQSDVYCYHQIHSHYLHLTDT